MGVLMCPSPEHPAFLSSLHPLLSSTQTRPPMLASAHGKGSHIYHIMLGTGNPFLGHVAQLGMNDLRIPKLSRQCRGLRLGCSNPETRPSVVRHPSAYY
jgi:hypothetical protein